MRVVNIKRTKPVGHPAIGPRVVPLACTACLIDSFCSAHGKPLVLLGDLQSRRFRFGVFQLCREEARFLRAKMPMRGIIQQDGHGVSAHPGEPSGRRGNRRQPTGTSDQDRALPAVHRSMILVTRSAVIWFGGRRKAELLACLVVSGLHRPDTLGFDRQFVEPPRHKWPSSPPAACDPCRRRPHGTAGEVPHLCSKVTQARGSRPRTSGRCRAKNPDDGPSPDRPPRKRLCWPSSVKRIGSGLRRT